MMEARRTLCLALVLTAFVSSYELGGVHATRPARPLGSRIYNPYFCPSDVALTKLRYNQGESDGYIQYTEYDTEIPRMSSFTMHYWFNLENTKNTSTIFNYGTTRVPSLSNLLTVQIDVGSYHYFKLVINGHPEKFVRIDPPLVGGQWYHALHTWDSKTGFISHYLDGKHLETYLSYSNKGTFIPHGGLALSGQRLNTLDNGMDRGEGLNGWLTLFELSTKPLGVQSTGAHAKVQLAAQCSGDLEGNVISWVKTGRKGYGGVSEVPSFSKACGRF